MQYHEHTDTAHCKLENALFRAWDLPIQSEMSAHVRVSARQVVVLQQIKLSIEENLNANACIKFRVKRADHDVQVCEMRTHLLLVAMQTRVQPYLPCQVDKRLGHTTEDYFWHISKKLPTSEANQA